jgi:hypothetical protein
MEHTAGGAYHLATEYAAIGSYATLHLEGTSAATGALCGALYYEIIECAQYHSTATGWHQVQVCVIGGGADNIIADLYVTAAERSVKFLKIVVCLGERYT